MRYIKTRYGDLAVPRDAEDLICKHLHDFGEWAWLEVAFVARAVSSGARIFDIGAFVGTFGLGMQRAHPSISSVTFCEANPLIFPLLAENISNLSTTDAHCVNAVVAGEKTSLVGFMPEHNMGALSFTPEATGTRQVHSPKATTLKNLRTEFGDYDLVKIDAEGMELLILTDDEQYLRTKKPALWLECQESSKSLETAAYLLSLGYNLQYFAFSSFNHQNFNKNYSRIYPMSFEAGLLATRTPLDFHETAATEESFALPISTADDIREALWLTPRWGLPGWEKLTAANLAALAGRYYNNERYSLFLRSEQTLSHSDNASSEPTTLTKPPDIARTAIATPEDVASKLAVQAQNIERDKEIIHALVRGRATLIQELETLRLHQAHSDLRERVFELEYQTGVAEPETTYVMTKANSSGTQGQKSPNHEINAQCLPLQLETFASRLEQLLAPHQRDLMDPTSLIKDWQNKVAALEEKNRSNIEKMRTAQDELSTAKNQMHLAELQISDQTNTITKLKHKLASSHRRFSDLQEKLTRLKGISVRVDACATKISQASDYAARTLDAKIDEIATLRAALQLETNRASILERMIRDYSVISSKFPKPRTYLQIEKSENLVHAAQIPKGQDGWEAPQIATVTECLFDARMVAPKAGPGKRENESSTLAQVSEPERQLRAMHMKIMELSAIVEEQGHDLAETLRRRDELEDLTSRLERDLKAKNDEITAVRGLIQKTILDRLKE